MNGPKEILQHYQSVNAKFHRKHYPKILKATRDIESSLIGIVKQKGLQAALQELSLMTLNPALATAVEAMYRDVGGYWAKNNYRAIRSQINRKGLGEASIWISEILALLRRHLLEYVLSATLETLKMQYLKVLEQGIREQMSEFEMVQLLNGSGIARAQAQRVVRTEVNRAANTGKMVVAKKFAWQMDKEWISHRDMRVRGFSPVDSHDHLAMNGQRVDVDELFTDPKSGEQIAHPGAEGGSAAMTINCRCTFVTIPRRDDNGNLIPK